MAQRVEGRLGVYVGSSRQGKTVSVKKDIRKGKLRRVIVWSIKEIVDKYGEMPLGVPVVYSTNPAHLLAVVRKIGKRNALVIYSGPVDTFTHFCRIAFAWGKLKPCAIVAEELADVSSPAKAPAGWGEVCRQSLGFGCDVYAITQRPAESDKTAMGNKSYIVIHHLERAMDRKNIAMETDLPISDISGLKKLEWIRKEHGEVTRGKHVFTTPQA